MPPWKIYSEASVGKAHLEAMGLRKWLKSDHGFPDWLIATINETYLGGRTECAIRRTPAPGVYVDFTSQYPTVFSLMGLWPYLTAERIAWREIPPDQVQRRLDAVTVDDVLDPTYWEGLAVICRVAPDGDRLPTRAKYRASRRATKAAKRSRAYNVATPVRSGGPEQHYTLADCVASKLMTGKAPRVTRAWAFKPVGQQPNLAAIDIAGEAEYRLDPGSDDFIRRLVELRADAETEAKDAKARGDEASTRWWDAVARAMKVTANAIAYGSAIEMSPIEHRKPVWVTVHLSDGDSYRTRVPRSEQPGGWFNPLVATLFAAGGRLLLATAMRLVTDAGGHYAFCDTDSLFIVATKNGGTVPPHSVRDAGVPAETGSEAPPLPALTWDTVNRIVARFVALNPYDPASVPGSILKIEDDNFDPETGQQREIECFSIASKRYALFTRDPDGRPVIVRSDKDDRRSAHGLGHLLPPYAHSPDLDDHRWIDQWWQHLLDRELGFDHPPPAWFPEPAIGRLTISSQRDKTAFTAYNTNRPCRDQIHFGNFLVNAHPTTAERASPHGARSLIAPFERDPHKRRALDWIDRSRPHDPPSRLVVGRSLGQEPDEAAVLAYQDYFDDYCIHPEAKASTGDGERCKPWTRGLLQPRHVKAGSLQRIGKEANRLADTPTPEDDAETPVIEYRTPDRKCRGCDTRVAGRRRWCSEACRKRAARRRR